MSGLALITMLLIGLVDGVVVGRPLVVSPGMLAFDGRRVALWGIRVPTADEMCASADGTRWACGAYAISALYLKVADRSVWCVRKARRRDSMVAQCFIGIVDVAQELVAQGWAESDQFATPLYGVAEAESRRAERGLWMATRAIPDSVGARGP